MGELSLAETKHRNNRTVNSSMQLMCCAVYRTLAHSWQLRFLNGVINVSNTV